MREMEARKQENQEFGHDECCGGTSVLGMLEGKVHGGGQSRLESVGRWNLLGKGASA